jgi:hypothetical protein
VNEEIDMQDINDELLEALKAITGAVQLYVNGFEDWPEVELALSAIAKAEEIE